MMSALRSGDDVRRRAGGIGPWLEGFAPLPAIADPAERLSAHLVARTIDLILGATALFIVIVLLAPAPAPRVYAITLPLALAFMLGLRRFLHRGHVRSVARALCAFGWAIIGADLWVYGPNTIAAGGFVIIIMVGGLTLGGAGAVALSIATVVALVPFMLGLVHGPFPAPTNAERLVHYTTQVALGATLASWWARRMRVLLAELRRSEARRTLLLEESPDAIVSTDRHGVVTFMNRAAEEMLGYPASDAVGRPWRDLPSLRGADPRLLGERLVRPVRTSDPGPFEEIVLSHRDGHPLVVEVKGVALRDEGKVVGTMSILRDVSERKHADAERAALQQRLATAQRMEAMGRIAGGVAHDFNNLLTIILCAADSVRDGPADEALADVRDAAQRGAVLTRQLLTFSRRQVSHPVPTDVNRAIRDMQPMLQRLLGDRITAELSLAPQLPAVVIDPAQLDQVLLNLVANARDAMPSGGTLTISTKPLDDGGRVEIIVTDTGVGMDAATLASMFEPFFSTKGERGTGLGLAVVEGVVRAAGGAVTATSEPGQGTAFSVALPSTDRPPSQAPPVSGEGERKAWRVVLVDDDPSVRRAVAASLRAAAFVVEELPGPKDLADVASVEGRLGGMDALVTDMLMPRVNGVDLALELRRRGCGAPIVFVSGYAEHALVERTRGISRSRWLQKPFTADELSESLEQLVDRHALRAPDAPAAT
jgi:PAS domain S-box-containing protein